MAVLTLFCLIDGADTSFPVDIESTKTVDRLKKLIKSEIPKFDQIAAHDLTLWRVEIPDEEKTFTICKKEENMHVASSADGLEYPASKLSPPSKTISAIGTLKPGNIHIIVQPPPSVVAAGKQKLSEAFPNGTCPFGPYPFGSCCCCEKQINL
ncbi:MAG: hypothetical protein J3Q66DRAFT_186824 [Benniella sp.]|nr:MAG: hypothetical protein J3Q66DRAFT_186824 [Benniella sp.]